MKSLSVSSFAVAVAMVSFASSSYAQLSVGHVTVVHNHSETANGWAPIYTTATPINSDTTGGIFNTDVAAGTNLLNTWGGTALIGPGVTGVIGNVGPTGGTLRLDSYGSNLGNHSGDYVYDTTQGSMALHLAGGSLLPSISSAESNTGAYAGFDFTLTNTATAQSWALHYSLYTPSTGTVTAASTLPVPVGPGDYLLSWTSTESFQVGNSRPGYATLNLAVVPEPATAVALAAGLIGLRRRRR